MQVFEFYFNPEAKEGVIYDSFVFEPENVWERKVGKLYMIGHLSYVLPQNIKFLENLSSQIKKEYYRVTERSPEIALQESLKKANEFLAEEAKKGNVSWLGNLDFAILSIKEDILNFTTTGDISLFILRGGQITDVNQTLRLQEIEPYPLKIFGNIVSGKLSPLDRLVVLTEELFEFFTSGNLLQKIAKLGTIEEKQLKRIFQGNEELYLKVAGICFLVNLTQEETIKEKVTFGKKILPLSIWQTLLGFFKASFQKLAFRLKRPQIRVKAPEVPKLPAFNLPVINLRISLPKINISRILKRNSILILALVFILLVGGFLTNLENQRLQKKARQILEEVKVEIQLAQEAVSGGDENEANSFYQKAWNKVLPLAESDSPVEDESLELKELIESQLLPLNKFKKIDNPELIFDFETVKFTPQRMVDFENNLYFFNPLSENIYQLKPEEKKADLFQIKEKFNLAADLRDNGLLLFFSRPNKLLSFKEGGFRQAFLLKEPYSDYQFNNFTIFKSNLYFLDSEKGEILKYVFNQDWIEFQGSLWFNPEAKRPTEARSLAVDGSVWVLTKKGEIEKYTRGSFKEGLEISFFPYLEKPTKIFTTETLPYLYILEPIKKRVIIINKEGEIFKQFQSDKFNNLKDFSVAENGKVIYLLNGLRVYKIKL